VRGHESIEFLSYFLRLREVTGGWEDTHSVMNLLSCWRCLWEYTFGYKHASQRSTSERPKLSWHSVQRTATASDSAPRIGFIRAASACNLTPPPPPPPPPPLPHAPSTQTRNTTCREQQGALRPQHTAHSHVPTLRSVAFGPAPSVRPHLSPWTRLGTGPVT
jgi:hypothetical protein